VHLLVSEKYIDSIMHGATIKGNNPNLYSADAGIESGWAIKLLQR